MFWSIEMMGNVNERFDFDVKKLKFKMLFITSIKFYFRECLLFRILYIDFFAIYDLNTICWKNECRSAVKARVRSMKYDNVVFSWRQKTMRRIMSNVNDMRYLW